MSNHHSAFCPAGRTPLSDLHGNRMRVSHDATNKIGSFTLQGLGWPRVLLLTLSHIRSDNSTLRNSPFLTPLTNTACNGVRFVHWSKLLAVHSSGFSPGYRIKSLLAFFSLSQAFRECVRSFRFISKQASHIMLSQGKRLK